VGLGILLLWWIVSVIVAAIRAAFSTPYPWIILGASGLSYTIYRVAQVIRRERLEALFFEAAAALHASSPEAPDLLGMLERRGRDHADAMLLVGAGAASRGQYQSALNSLDRAVSLSGSIGQLSGGIFLAFPGLGGALSFRSGGRGLGSLEVARMQLRILSGHPLAAIETLKLSNTDPAYPLGLSALAEAHAALGDIDRAAAALRQAVNAPGCDPALATNLGYRLARLREAHGDRPGALRAYEALVAQGGQNEAAKRIEALREEIEQERQREKDARRRQEEAQRREALANAISRADELRTAGSYENAVTELRRALKLSNDTATTRALRYKLAVTLEAGGMPTQAVPEYEALGQYEDARARLKAIRVEEEAQYQRAVRAQEEEILRQARAKIEVAKGPAGGRAAVRAGLERLTIQELRDKLLVEASRIEVEAVLEKVDGLKTAAAKRRNLLAALETLRADEIPDELQAQQIRWLEDALAELEK
jgi:tetratricopeptide (TPR) repeat protein